MGWFSCHVLSATRYAAATDRNLKVHKLLGKCAHLVVEAERVVADLLRREDKVALSLLFALQDDLSARALDSVVDIERATRLNLWQQRTVSARVR